MKEPDRYYVNADSKKKTYNRRKALAWYTNGHLVYIFHFINGKWHQTGAIHSKSTDETML